MTEEVTIFDPNTLKASAHIASDRWIENLRRSLIWIGVEELLPPEGMYVLCATMDYPHIFISRLVDGEWDTGGGWRRPAFFQNEKVMTRRSPHFWMPLPNAPV